MKVRTSSKGAAGLKKVMAELARVRSRVTTQVAGDIQGLIDQQFADGTDPYGNAWAPTQRGNDPVLTESGTMASSADVSPMSGAGIQITIDGPAAYHQSGTSRMPARPPLPADGMPDAWADAIEDAVDAAMQRAASQA